MQAIRGGKIVSLLGNIAFIKGGGRLKSEISRIRRDGASGYTVDNAWHSSPGVGGHPPFVPLDPPMSLKTTSALADRTFLRGTRGGFSVQALCSLDGA